MTKQIKLIAIVTVGCLMFFMLSALVVIKDNDKRTQQALGQVEEVSAQYEEYYITNLDGYIAVYQPEQSQPMEVTDILISQLRMIDQDMLNRGVFIYGKENLLNFLEDFGP